MALGQRPCSPQRADIEGLRAVAVLAVLLHHAWPQALPGGFAGVDIFFVISGYLMGRALLQRPPLKPADWVAFWARRARRILPALTVVAMTTWLVCASFMTSSEFEGLSRHTAAAAVFANNLVLGAESGYFARAASAQPLLHLWSLSVEEQFYLVLPPLIAAGLAFERRPVAWVVRLGAASWVGMLLFSASAEVAAFYGLLTRFWELSAGAGLALWLQARTPTPTSAQSPNAAVSWVSALEWRAWCVAMATGALLSLADALTQSGPWPVALGAGFAALAVLALMLGPGKPGPLEPLVRWLPWWGVVALFITLAASPSQAWPSAATALPVLGTLALLAAGQRSGPAVALASRPLVAVGGISYPLYLWHWPLLASAQVWAGGRRPALTFALLAGAGLLAWMTRRWVEDPVRFGRHRATGRHRVPLGLPLLALAAVGAMGTIGWRTKGLPQRLPDQLVSLEAWSDPLGYDAWRPGRCFHFLNNQGSYAAECTPAAEPGRLRVLLWGDSHAAQLFPGLQTMAAEHHFTLMQWTTGSCPPTPQPLLGEGSACPAKRAWARQELARQKPDVVVLAGAWGLYSQFQSPEHVADAVVDAVRTTRQAGQAHIVVFGAGPTWGSSLRDDLLRHMWTSRNYSEVPARLQPPPGQAQTLDRLLRTRVEALGARHVSVMQELCNPSGCLTLGDRTQVPPDLLFFDRDHLTVAGSRLLVTPLIDRVLRWP